MPKKYTITYHPATAPIREPITKFGGQPVWLDEPQWPLSRDYGTPMQFICQIALDPALFGETISRMAYLFITDDEEHGYLAETFDLNGGENAVILQPGGIWEGPAQPLREGPSLYQREWVDDHWAHTSTEFAVTLTPGDDPEPGMWDEIDSDDKAVWDAYFSALIEDKVGGVPVPTPNKVPQMRHLPYDWRLLLQLNTKGEDPSDLFFLNFASDGVGYVFISPDGRAGKFFWSR